MAALDHLRKWNLFSRLALACCAAIGSVALPVRAGVADTVTNEFWIGPTANSGNLGTWASPFDGSTQERFDRVLFRIPPGATVHLLPGIYMTRGSKYENRYWNIRSGQKILGSGIDRTILRLVPGARDQTAVLRSEAGTIATNIEVCDLTLDCNYRSGNFTYHGIALFGTRSTVRRVKVINTAKFSGTEGVPESYAIYVATPFGRPIDSEGNIVESCEVSNHRGGPIAAIHLVQNVPGHRISGIFRNNRVLLSTDPAVNQEAHIALAGVWTDRWIVEGNYVQGGQVGFYGENGYRNTLIRSNVFNNCDLGVFLRNVGHSPTSDVNLTFAQNTIRLNTAYQKATAFLLSQSGDTSVSFTNLVIIGNRVLLNDPPGLTPYYFIRQADPGSAIVGLTVTENVVDPRLKNQVLHASLAAAHKNVDLQGNIYAPLGNMPRSNMRMP